MEALTAKQIMTHEVMKVPAIWSIKRLAEYFMENAISGAPVVSDNGKLLGVVTSTDILRNDSMTENDTNTHGPHDYYLHSLENRYTKVEIASLNIGSEPPITVGDIMTPSVLNVDEDTSIQDVAAKMIKYRIHRIFVTKKEKITGIISALDMLKVIRNMKE